MDDMGDLLALAEGLRNRKRWGDAEKMFRRAAEVDPGIATQLALGTFLAERQDYGGAIRSLMSAFDCAQSDGDVAAQGAIFSNLAAIYRELGEFDLAQRFQRQALALHETVDAEDLLAWSAEALVAKKTSLAGELANQALELSDDIGTQADAYGLLGLVAARQAKPRDAIRLMIRAARGHQHVGDDRSLGIDYQNLAEACGLIDRFRWQRAFLETAGKLFDDEAMPRSAERVRNRQRDGARLALIRDTDALCN